MSKDLKAMFGFKPLKVRIVLVVSSEGMEATTFSSMRETMKAIGMGEKVIRYTKNNGRDFMSRFESRSIWVFCIKWC